MTELGDKQQLLGQYNAMRDAQRREIDTMVPAASMGVSRKDAVDKITRRTVALRFRERTKAIKDEKTTLYSQRYFAEQLRMELNQAKRANKSIALALGDVRRLKQYNDTYGHVLGGDRVLRSIGRSIKEGVQLRASDIPCRTGGDEMGVIYTAISPEHSENPRTEKENVAIAALRTLQEIHAHPVKLAENDLITPHLDIGVTLSSLNDSPESFQNRADQASYVAKKLFNPGDDKVVVATWLPKGMISFESAAMDAAHNVTFTPIPDALKILSSKPA